MTLTYIFFNFTQVSKSNKYNAKSKELVEVVSEYEEEDDIKEE